MGLHGDFPLDTVHRAFKIPEHMKDLFEGFVLVLERYPSIVVPMWATEPQYVIFPQGQPPKLPPFYTESSEVIVISSAESLWTAYEGIAALIEAQQPMGLAR